MVEAGMRDMNYVSMIHAIEAGTIPKDLPNENELKQMDGFWAELSVFMLRNGKSLILKGNKEILVPASERENITNICHSTHLGYNSMLL